MKVDSEMRQNWPFLAVAFVLIFFAFGVPTYSLPFMYSGAIEEFGWSKEQANYLSTFKFVTGGIAALGMGLVLDKLGGRGAIFWGAAAGCCAMTMFLGATNLPVYYSAGVLLGFSASSIMAAMKIVVTRLFVSSQGLALGITMTATSAAGIFTPQILPPMMEAYGWRQSVAMIGIGTLVIALPVWLLFLRMNPRFASEVSRPGVSTGTTGIWRHFLAISRDRNFWLIAVGIFIVSGVDQSMMQNYVLFLREDKGMDWRAVSWGGSLLAVIGMMSKVGSGWVYDRLSIKGIAIFYFLLAISLFLGLPVTGFATMLVFIIVRGIAHGGLIVDVPVLTRHYFGPERFGLTLGIMVLVMNLGFATGPPLLGRMADIYGDYATGMTIYGCAALVATLLLLPVRPRHWQPRSKDPVVNTGATAPAS